MSCKLSNSKSSDEINNNKSSLELSFSLGKLRKLCLTFPMPNLLIEGDMGMRGVLQLSSKKKIVCIVCHSSEIRGLRIMKCSSEMLQNLLYFKYK